MKYEDVVAAYRARSPAIPFDFITDRERVEFALSLAGKVAKQETSKPKFNCWSSNEGDSWFDHPADAQLLEDVGAEKVGDEFEVSAGWSCVTARYRVIKAPDDLNDDFEVECISHREESKPAATAEKQEPVAWVIVENGKCVATRSANFSHISDGQYRLYTTPRPCPECEERKTTALNYISLTFEFEHLQSKCEKLKSEVAGWKLTLDQVVSETANELGCLADNEAILSAVDTLKAERDELAAQVEKMRDALEESQRWHHGDKWRGNHDTALRAAWDEHMNTLVSALALPDLSTSILNRVRAEALRKAADIFESKAIGSANMSSIRALAADMEAGK